MELWIIVEILLLELKQEHGELVLIFWVIPFVFFLLLLLPLWIWFDLIWFFVWIGNEFCERLAYYGMSSNLVLYFKHHLNQDSATASKNVNNWSGTCYITPLIGAFLADAYLGRYRTIAAFSIVYVFVSSNPFILLSNVYFHTDRNHVFDMFFFLF